MGSEKNKKNTVIPGVAVCMRPNLIDPFYVGMRGMCWNSISLLIDF